MSQIVRAPLKIHAVTASFNSDLALSTDQPYIGLRITADVGSSRTGGLEVIVGFASPVSRGPYILHAVWLPSELEEIYNSA